MKAGDIVLVDTNVIIEGHLASCWAALTGAYRVETVEECIVEAMTGDYDWNGTRPPESKLRVSFNAIHGVSNLELAEVKLAGGASLHPGEQALWAHALARNDAWILCGPDRASMRFGYEQNQRDRLVSLGALLQQVDFKPPKPLRSQFEQRWLQDVVTKLILGIL